MTTHPAAAAGSPTGPIGTGPTREPTRVPLPDGVSLAATWHRPAADRAPTGIAVLAPGVAVPARRLHPLGDALAALGWAGISFDYAGMGASATGHARTRRGDRLGDWGARDLDAVVRTAHDEAAGRPLVLVGHSAGAWLIGLTPTALDVDAVVALASHSGYWRHFARRERPTMLVHWYLTFPTCARVLGYVPGSLGLGMDLPGGVAAQWAAWNRDPGFYPNDRSLAEDLHLDRLHAPVVDLLPSDDPWATPAAARHMWQQFPHAHVEYRTVHPADLGEHRLGHLGLLRASLAHRTARMVDDALRSSLALQP